MSTRVAASSVCSCLIAARLSGAWALRWISSPANDQPLRGRIVDRVLDLLGAAAFLPALAHGGPVRLELLGVLPDASRRAVLGGVLLEAEEAEAHRDRVDEIERGVRQRGDALR